MQSNDLTQLNTVAFIVDQPFVLARAGDKVEFHDFLVNLTNTDITLGGPGAGMLVPNGLHGSAFPFSYNPAFPQTLPSLSMVGLMRLFTVALPYGSVRPSDQFLIGFTVPLRTKMPETQQKEILSRVSQRSFK